MCTVYGGMHMQRRVHYVCMGALRVYGSITCVWVHYVCMGALRVYGRITCVWAHYVCMGALRL